MPNCSTISEQKPIKWPKERSLNGARSCFYNYNMDSETTASFAQGQRVRIMLP